MLFLNAVHEARKLSGEAAEMAEFRKEQKLALKYS